jgi:hypothetical protein
MYFALLMKPIYKALFWYFWNMIFGIAPFLIFGYLWISIDDKMLGDTAKLEITNIQRLILIQIIAFVAAAIFCIFVKENILSKESKLAKPLSRE